MIDLILASASPRRLDLLKTMGIVPQQVIPADIDETPHERELPAHLAKRLSVEKALTVSKKYPKELILAADTVVACGRRIIDKTSTPEEARIAIGLLSGRSHTVYSGICLAKEGQFISRVIQTKVKFKRLSKEEQDAYIKSGEWEGKAGGYAIQGLAATYVRSINGSYTNILGLCSYNTSQMLRGFSS